MKSYACLGQDGAQVKLCEDRAVIMDWVSDTVNQRWARCNDSTALALGRRLPAPGAGRRESVATIRAGDFPILGSILFKKHATMWMFGVSSIRNEFMLYSMTLPASFTRRAITAQL